ncbi:MAG: HlyD family secretion protein [Defluviitaleaceae bacterium]|nr:HlyD family secretion protein [Defluviitaleaceae bacterium]MCL2276055.1 HlyD family secretion protein [Defluviitaleaceae bacterium]
MAYERILKIITIAFIALLAGLTFFSQTLMDMRAPRVSVEFIQGGVIAPQAIASGTVNPVNTERIFAPISGRITEIVRLGDAVNAATVLFSITTDMRVLNDNLTAAMHDQRVAELNIERLENDRTTAQQQLNAIINEPVTAVTAPTLQLLEHDLQLDANERDMNALRLDIQQLEILYAEGVVPRQQLTQRENELERLAEARRGLYERRLQAIAAYEAALRAYEDTTAATARNRQNQIRSQQNQLLQIGFQMRGLLLDLERTEARIELLMAQIEADGITEVRLPAGAATNRMVSAITAGVDIGAMVSEGAPILTTVIRDNTFEVEAAFPRSASFIHAGLNADIIVGTDRLSGTVSRIVPQGGRNVVFIDIPAAQNVSALLGGEFARVTIQGRTTPASTIIPISALRQDNFSYYVYYIEAVPRRFGYHHIVQISRVQPAARDNQRVAITGLHGMELPTGAVVVNTDMPVQVGTQVRLVGGHEFVGTR